eukprot:g5100.t1
MVGRVIGKNGETIKALQNYSGAQIQIDQTTDPMKVTITGTQQSLNLAISMVTDIVNGNFKGFAMLRQHASEQGLLDGTTCQPMYAPGYGLIPPSQMYASQLDTASVKPSQPMSEAIGNFNGLLSTALASQEDSTTTTTPSSYILGLAHTKLPSSLAANAISASTNTGTFSSLASILNGLPPQGSFPTSSTGSPLGTRVPTLATQEMLTPSYIKTVRTTGEGNLGFSDFPSTGGSPFSGSLSPDLSTGWPNAGAPLTGEFSTPLESYLLSDLTSNAMTVLPNVSCCSPPVDPDAVQLHRLSDYVTGGASSKGSVSSSGSSADSTSEKVGRIGSGVGTGPALSSHHQFTSSNSIGGNDNVVYLVDPSGRPFSVNIVTGETEWLNTITENHGGLLKNNNTNNIISINHEPFSTMNLKQALLSE